MNKNKFAIIFDGLIFSFIIFVISYFWGYKILKIRNLSFAISIIIFSICFIFYTYHNEKKNNKLIKNSQEKLLFDNTLKTLKFQGVKENSNYFTKLLSCSYLGDNIYKKDDCYLYINFQTELSVFDFFIVNNFYTQTDKSLPLVFLAEKANENFSNLITESPIKYEVQNQDYLIKVIKEKQIFPIDIEILKTTKTPKNLKVILKKLKYSLSNIKFTSTFFTGLSLVILSIFIPYSLYYLIFGTIFLILAFLSLLFKRNKNNSNIDYNCTVSTINFDNNQKKLQ